jgi:hypothetical protein
MGADQEFNVIHLVWSDCAINSCSEASERTLARLIRVDFRPGSPEGSHRRVGLNQKTTKSFTSECEGARSGCHIIMTRYL